LKLDTNHLILIQNERPVLSSERAPHMDRIETFKEEEISGHEPRLIIRTIKLHISEGHSLILKPG
jgi:hypothetical protein